MSQVREYETLYIIAPELEEEEQKAMMEAAVSVVTKNGGEIVKNDIWGKRKLAYPIKKRTEGVYVLLRFRGEAGIPTGLETFVHRTPAVLRHLTTVVTRQQTKEEARLREAETKRAEEAARREAEDARRAEEAAAKEAAEAAAAEVAAAEAAVAEEATETASEEASPANPETAREETADAGTVAEEPSAGDEPKVEE